MAITRRQFVTRLGALTAALGLSQADLAKIGEAFAHTDSVWSGAWTAKPKVIWVHGAECTGCSTSLLSFFEDVTANAVDGMEISTLTALDFAVGGDGDGDHVLGPASASPPNESGHPFGHRTLYNTRDVCGANVEAVGGTSVVLANIADVLVDFISLEYHETVMGMGGDLAHDWLKAHMTGNGDTMTPYVLVVEGAVQKTDALGFAEVGTPSTQPWCSIAADGGSGEEVDFGDVVNDLASKAACKAVIAMGQCATYGGYPGCTSPTFNVKSTPAFGVYEYLADVRVNASAAAKVVNVPGCPTNPWWMVLTIVAWLVDFTTVAQGSGPTLGVLKADASINPAAVDSQGRLVAVYGTPLHDAYCPRNQDFLNGVKATRPGEKGCLQLIGCAGMSTNSTCGTHGWNNQQPGNVSETKYGIASINGKKGGSCIAAGAPCMGCTEKGYPDRFVPFIYRG